jgi:excisionase family DNA binding protein
VNALPDDEPVLIPEAASEQIAEVRRLLEDGRVKLVGSAGHQVELTDAVQQMVLRILKNLQAGKAVSIFAGHREVATESAAHILGVSPPFLVRLLEEGHIPFHIVGSHRRIYLRDLHAYKHRRDNARHEILDRLAKTELADGTYDKVFLPTGAEEE